VATSIQNQEQAKPISLSKIKLQLPDSQDVPKNTVSDVRVIPFINFLYQKSPTTKEQK